MLQQILHKMDIEPEILEALNEEQKKILFLKMRQEQVRRWKEREEKLDKEGCNMQKSRPSRVHRKNVSWLLGRDGDVQVFVIGETDELKTTKIIYSDLGEKKAPSVNTSSRHKSPVQNSNLVNRIPAESSTLRTGRENLKPKPVTGIKLKFQEKNEELKSAPHCCPMQAQKDAEEDLGSDNSTDSLKEAGILCRHYLKHRSAASITEKPNLPDSKESHAVPLSSRARLCPQDSLEQHRVRGRDFRVMPASKRSVLVGMAGEGEVEHVGVIRGRVAQLRKNFSSVDIVPHVTHPKPPVPAKPTHLNPLASPSLWT